MTSVSCWCNDCRWEQHGCCNRGHIIISEDYECECYESYREEYKESFYKAYIKDGEKYRKLATNGKKSSITATYFTPKIRLPIAEIIFLPRREQESEFVSFTN